eukprot:CAMPEP_0206027240 /NCGR_PEP_ID=MMETSP1464-20131121/42983_1 /ASSEMBLY_ACC=CAM_ASM_001124 /TAXON_ID=119497 /ORGANISM="Exanthemachrysis gayraliae, Strain RCC1523" /LENGTH=268 /DNA_ID=CAMNT_0053401281 /DNA_START=24 /DNA_END=827 /DNA_ORIENTATION=-
MGWNIVRKLCPRACTVALKAGCKNEEGEVQPPEDWSGPGCEDVGVFAGGPGPAEHREKVDRHDDKDDKGDKHKKGDEGGGHGRHGGDEGAHHKHATEVEPLPVARPAEMLRRDPGDQAPRKVFYEGCYHDDPTHRDLRVRMGSNMGTDQCSRACRAFRYFALQGGECFCDDKFGTNPQLHRNQTRITCDNKCNKPSSRCCGVLCDGEHHMDPPRCCGDPLKHNAIYRQLETLSWLEDDGLPPSTAPRVQRLPAAAIAGAAALCVVGVS